MRIDCPYPEYEGAWIELPDTWKGLHLQRRDQAVQAAAEYGSSYLVEFAIAMALLDDWSIPGLNGNPERWDFTALDLRLIVWVRESVIPSFVECFKVPKKS